MSLHSRDIHWEKLWTTRVTMEITTKLFSVFKRQWDENFLHFAQSSISYSQNVIVIVLLITKKLIELNNCLPRNYWNVKLFFASSLNWSDRSHCLNTHHITKMTLYINWKCFNKVGGYFTTQTTMNVIILQCLSDSRIDC